MSPLEISRSTPMASDADFDGWLNAHGGSERGIVVAIHSTKRLPRGAASFGQEPGSLRGDGGCREGRQLAFCVGDLDLAGLGLLGYGDGCREHAVLVRGGDVLAVQALPEE
jgi:hypothetical protein